PSPVRCPLSLHDALPICPRPARIPFEGRYVRLEPLDAVRHGDGLYAVSSVADADQRFRWLGDYPPESRKAFQPWLDKAAAGDDPDRKSTRLNSSHVKISY